MKENTLILIRGYKKSALKYNECGKTGYKKEIYYKIHSELCPRRGGNGGNYIDNINTASTKVEKLKIKEDILNILITTNKLALLIKYSPNK